VKKNNFDTIEKLVTHDFALINYFQTDITKYKLLILIFKNYYEDNFKTIEEIVDLLPKEMSSRAHKLNCITDATVKTYLVKESLNSDMRKKYLKPSTKLIEEFEKYMSIMDPKNT
jgi:hypothetical protein|tara:strand:- start:13 stop:357 length:345 start_codon:yes stop_codon:yes gene_type:complete